MMKHSKALIALLALLAALPVFAQMQPAPPPAGEAQLIELKATVEDVDLAKRLITVKGPAGRTVVTTVDPKVPNLENVKAGDNALVKYYRAALQQAEKG